MARVVCFADTTAVSYAVQQGFRNTEHTIHLLSASQLTHETRDRVCRLAPDIILFELTPALDNAHLYFFLRSDLCTRTAPIILLSSSARLEQQAAILQANSYLRYPCATEQLQQVIADHLPRPHAQVAA